MFGLFTALFRRKPTESFVVQIREDDEWRSVAMSFPNHQAGVAYAKQHYSGHWAAARIRIVPISEAG